MAKVYIAEYAAGAPNAPIEPPIAEQTVAIGANTQSSAFNAATRFVRVHADAICSIAFGSNPTASVNTKRMAANQTEYFYVNGGDKIAVITNT